MKSILPFFALLVVFASCTTAYKAGQTPDDVYFSPARPQQSNDEYVRTDNRPDQYRYDDQQYEDDRYLRMKVQNRRMWSDLDYYYSDPFAYNYNYLNRYNMYGSMYYNTPWNYYSSWNYYYNPYSTFNNYYNPYYTPYGYGSKVVVLNPVSPVYNSPRRYNLNVYNTPSANNAYNNNSSRRVYRGDSRNFNYNNNYSNNSNSNNNAGSGLRNIFSGNSSNNNSSFNSSSRPSNNSSSSSSSAPSRSSSNAPVRKF